MMDHLVESEGCGGWETEGCLCEGVANECHVDGARGGGEGEGGGVVVGCYDGYRGAGGPGGEEGGDGGFFAGEGGVHGHGAGEYAGWGE